jgi:aminoglycoside phosphotransferase (APT) family kinase protein
LAPEALAALGAAIDAPDGDESPTLLDVGFSNIVVRFGSTVARLPRNAEAGEWLGREVAILRAIGARLPVRTAVPARLLAPSGSLPYGASLHPLLDGRTMTADDPVERPALLDEIVDLLVSLHEIEVTSLPVGSVAEREHVHPRTSAWTRVSQGNPLAG